MNCERDQARDGSSGRLDARREDRDDRDAAVLGDVVLPAVAESAREARELVRDALRRSATFGVDVSDAVLVTSELVANAVRQGAGPVRLVVRVPAGADRVRIEVSDGHAGRNEALPRAGDEDSGRGAAIVSALSRAWGVREAHGGTTVWAEIG